MGVKSGTRLLLFGASGQLGRTLAPVLASRGDLRPLGRADADLADPSAITTALEAWRPTLIINAAAHTAVDRAESESGLAHCVNALAPAAMAAWAARHDARLVHYSTDYVFDGSLRRPMREDDTPHPQSVYGRTKLAGEQAILASGCRHLILRTAWLYAPAGHNFLNTMLRLARERDMLRVVDDQIGCPTPVGVVTGATLALLDRWPDNGLDGIWHAVCAGETSWHGFASAIIENAGWSERVRVEPIATRDYPTPAVRPAWSVLSAEKFSQATGLRLPHWRDALDAVMRQVTRLA